MDTILEGSDLVIEENGQKSQRRTKVSENIKYLVLSRNAPSNLFSTQSSMIDFARGMIRPRQFKLTRIKEIVLSSRETNEKYIKLVFKTKRKGKAKGCDETLKFIFDNDSLFSIWTLALSALVYIWKWLEMPENRKQAKGTKEEEEAEARKQRQIHELGPTGKQLVADLLCSLISKDRVQKKHLENVSKLLTELEFWYWTPQDDPRRQLVLQYLSDLSDEAGGIDDDDKENNLSNSSVDSDSSSISRRHSAPIILSKLNDLYTIPEDLDSLNSQSLRSASQETNGLLLEGDSTMSPSKSQKIFERVSNCIVDYIESSDSEDHSKKSTSARASPSCSSGDENITEEDSHDGSEEVVMAMCTHVVHPVTAASASAPEQNEVDQQAAATAVVDSGENASTSSSAAGGGDKRDGNVPPEASECKENSSSKDFFSALNILERKSKWKRKLKHMKSVVLESLNGVESGVSALEERIQTSDLQKDYKRRASKHKAKCSSIVDQDVFKAAMWRSIIQLSLDIQSEKDRHQDTKVKLASMIGETTSVQDC
jgi:hypothetical protein